MTEPRLGALQGNVPRCVYSYTAETLFGLDQSAVKEAMAGFHDLPYYLRDW